MKIAATCLSAIAVLLLTACAHRTLTQEDLDIAEKNTYTFTKFKLAAQMAQRSEHPCDAECFKSLLENVGTLLRTNPIGRAILQHEINTNLQDRRFRYIGTSKEQVGVIEHPLIGPITGNAYVPGSYPVNRGYRVQAEDNDSDSPPGGLLGGGLLGGAVGPVFLGPYKPNAYGPGINSDATGRPFIWEPQGSGPKFFDPFLKVKPDVYGPGIGMDQYGRPVRPACPPGWAGPC
jgi:hypothetical protein